MKKLMMIVLALAFSTAHAARVEDVKVLDLKYGKDAFELRLQIKDGPKDSYFLVDIVKEDPKAFDKLALVIEKIQRKDMKLNLDIPSFSASPSGAYYRSLDVRFSGDSIGESLLGK